MSAKLKNAHRKPENIYTAETWYSDFFVVVVVVAIFAATITLMINQLSK